MHLLFLLCLRGTGKEYKTGLRKSIKADQVKNTRRWSGTRWVSWFAMSPLMVISQVKVTYPRQETGGRSGAMKVAISSFIFSIG